MANKCKTIFADICEHFLAFIIAILISVVIIVGVPLLCPFFIYRYCLKLCFKYFRPDLDKMLTCGNSLMVCGDDVYGLTQNTTVIAFKMKGILEIEEVRKDVTEKLLNAKTIKGVRKYPELMQYPTIWMGYYFWKYEDFDIKNHVAYYTLPEQGKVYSNEDVALIESELCTKSHTKNCSLWEIVIIPNVKSDSDNELHSAGFFRTHHGLMDGFAISKLLIEELAGEDLRKCGILFDLPKMNICQRLLYYCSLIFRIPYDIGVSLVKAIGITENDFRMGYEDLSPYQIGIAPLILPMDTFKEVRYSHKVGLLSVMTAVWIGALRRIMIDNNMKIPKGVIFGSPQPMPGHPGKLRVHAIFWFWEHRSGASMYYPIGIQDPVTRLKSIDKFLEFLKRTTSTQTLFYFAPILGSLPSAFVSAMIPLKPATGVINVFRGPSKVVSMFGKEVEDFHYSFGQQAARQSILFSGFSYAGNISMKITVNKNRFSEKSEVKKLYQYVLEELEALKQQDV